MKLHIKKTDLLFNLIVFVTGAAVMTTELVVSRVLAPYFGNSLYVWTILIGAMLGTISLGYYLGGVLVDHRPDLNLLSKIIFSSGILLSLVAFLKEPALSLEAQVAGDHTMVAAFFSTVALFGPATVLLGMISPFLAKLKLNELKDVGKTMGGLYFYSTVGSIFGTFMGGLFLIPRLGHTNSLYLCAGILVLLAALVDGKKVKLILGISMVFSLIYMTNQLKLLTLNSLEDIDTLYNRIIVEKLHLADNTDLITFRTDHRMAQSAMLLQQPELLYSKYLQYFRLSYDKNLAHGRALLIGGGGLVFVGDFLRNNPDAVIDVVEIDPTLTEIANKYFFYESNPRSSITNVDGRLFVRNTANNYDVVYVDAFSGVSAPFQLTTLEFIREIDAILNPNGLLMMNVASRLKPSENQFIASLVKTMTQVFSHVELFPVYNNPEKNQNIVILASRNKLDYDHLLKTAGISGSHFPGTELVGNGRLLTDDRAPTDYINSRRGI